MLTSRDELVKSILKTNLQDFLTYNLARFKDHLDVLMQHEGIKGNPEQMKKHLAIAILKGNEVLSMVLFRLKIILSGTPISTEELFIKYWENYPNVHKALKESGSSLENCKKLNEECEKNILLLRQQNAEQIDKHVSHPLYPFIKQINDQIIDFDKLYNITIPTVNIQTSHSEVAPGNEIFLEDISLNQSSPEDTSPVLFGDYEDLEESELKEFFTESSVNTEHANNEEQNASSKIGASHFFQENRKTKFDPDPDPDACIRSPKKSRT